MFNYKECGNFQSMRTSISVDESRSYKKRKDNQENTNNNLEFNLDSFNKQFEQNLQNLSSNKITDINSSLQVLVNMNNIYSQAEIVPQLVKSGMLNSILDSVQISAPLVFQLLTHLLSCTIDNTILLLQNNILSIILSGFFHEDIGISQQATECLELLFDKNNCFIFSLIISTGIVERIVSIMHDSLINKSQTIFIEDERLFCFFSVMNHIFYNGPIPGEEQPINNAQQLGEQFSCFIQNCNNPSIFIFELYTNFIQRGISMSKCQPYYPFLEYSFQLLENSKNEVLHKISFHTIYIIIRNQANVNIILDRVPVFDNMEKYLNINGNDNFSLWKIQCWLIARLPQETPVIIIEELQSFTLSLFDEYIMTNKFSQAKNSPEKYIICAIKNLVDIDNKFSKKFIKDIRKKINVPTRKEFILYKANEADFSTSKMYVSLCLSIAYQSGYSNIINAELLARILEMMRKNFSGAHTQNALSVIDKILSKEKVNGKCDFEEMVQNVDGVDLLYDMMDCDDENVAKDAERIFDKHFNHNRMDE